jgi:ATP-dependent protease HslVU (ClpYQ) peptidase subunit
MTFTSRHITIGTAAVAIGTATLKNTHELTIESNDNKTVYVGDESVTVGGGFEIVKNAVVPIKIANGDILWAVSGSSDAVISVFDFQVDP